MNREAQILQALANSSLSMEARRALTDELYDVRAEAARRHEASRSIDFDAASAHLTPVQPYVPHTAETDWLGRVAAHGKTAQQIHAAAKAEASRWFTTIHPQIVADRTEFAIQATGKAHQWAGQWGDDFRSAVASFLQQAGHLAGFKVAECSDDDSGEDGEDGDSNGDAEKSDPPMSGEDGEMEDDDDYDGPRKESSRRQARLVNVWDLKPGDVLLRGEGATPDPENDTVEKVDGVSGMWIIDFTNGQSTPPLGNGQVYVASRRRTAAWTKTDQKGSFGMADVWQSSDPAVYAYVFRNSNSPRVRVFRSTPTGDAPGDGFIGMELVTLPLPSRNVSDSEIQNLLDQEAKLDSFTSSLRSRRTAGAGQTCSVCGDKIAQTGGSWHHDNGEKHDHEAKPGGGDSKESSRRTAVSQDVAAASAFLGKLNEGDPVIVVIDGQEHQMAVSRRLSSGDPGGYGAMESSYVIVSFGPGRYSTNITVRQQASKSPGMPYIKDGTTASLRVGYTNSYGLNDEGPTGMRRGDRVWIEGAVRATVLYVGFDDINNNLGINPEELGFKMYQDSYPVAVTTGDGVRIVQFDALSPRAGAISERLASTTVKDANGNDVEWGYEYDDDYDGPRKESSRRSARLVNVWDLQPGDVLLRGEGATPDPENDTVEKVDGVNGMWIVDFTNGQSTPPLGNGQVYVASRRTVAESRSDKKVPISEVKAGDVIGWGDDPSLDMEVLSIEMDPTINKYRVQTPEGEATYPATNMVTILASRRTARWGDNEVEFRGQRFVWEQDGDEVILYSLMNDGGDELDRMPISGWGEDATAEQTAQELARSWVNDGMHLKGFTGRRRLAADGQTCSVCGDKIAQTGGSWHHDSGTKHDHEAKPSKESSRRVSVSLSNVRLEDGGAGGVCTGTDPSGNTVRFRVTPQEVKDLKSIMFSDLAINFSGMDVAESDIIREGSLRTAGRTSSRRTSGGAPSGETDDATQTSQTPSTQEYTDESDFDVADDFDEGRYGSRRIAGASIGDAVRWNGTMYYVSNQDDTGQIAITPADDSGMPIDRQMGSGLWVSPDEVEVVIPRAQHPMFAQASRRTAADDWWPLVPSTKYPGERDLVCPTCGSPDVSISGNNLGRDIITNNLYTSLTCNSCGRRDVFLKKPKSRYSSSRTAVSLPARANYLIRWLENNTTGKNDDDQVAELVDILQGLGLEWFYETDSNIKVVTKEQYAQAKASGDVRDALRGVADARTGSRHSAGYDESGACERCGHGAMHHGGSESAPCEYPGCDCSRFRKSKMSTRRRDEGDFDVADDFDEGRYGSHTASVGQIVRDSGWSAPLKTLEGESQPRTRSMSVDALGKGGGNLLITLTFNWPTYEVRVDPYPGKVVAKGETGSLGIIEMAALDWIKKNVTPEWYMAEKEKAMASVAGLRRRASDVPSPSPESQNGYGESSLPDVTVSGAPEDTNLGWIDDDPEGAYDQAPQGSVGPFDASVRIITNTAGEQFRIVGGSLVRVGEEMIVGPSDAPEDTNLGWIAEGDPDAQDEFAFEAPDFPIANEASLHVGQLRIEEGVGYASGNPIFTVQYMPDNEDSWSYGVWENVKTFLSRDDAERYIADHEAKFPKDSSLHQAMPNPVDLGIQVGDIFYSSWGYDQTNVDFYQVVGLTGASVKVRQIAQRTVRSGGAGGDSVVAVPDHFVGEVMTKRIQNYRDVPTFSLNSYSDASLWDGTPKYQTGFGFGH